MRRILLGSTIVAAGLVLSACGTLTGIPGHGGGKRFVEEQRLVSASIRGSLEEIDVQPLVGKRVALVFSLISDEGAGNIVGGRASLSAILTGGTIVSPVTTRSNEVEVYTLASSGTSQANTTSASTGSNTSSVAIVGQTTNNTTQSTAANTVTTTNGTTSTPATTTTNSTPATTTTSTTTTGATTTDQTVNNPATTTTTNNPAVTTTTNSTVETTNPDVTTNSTGTSNSTQTGNENSSSNTNGTQTGQTTGTQEQTVVTGFTQQTRGHREDVSATLNYDGLGTYQTIGVPKSDASLLMSLTRNYFILNGIEVTTPQDPTAEAIAYVTVDIFGTDRKRTDLILYNNERLSAETAIEIFAADRSGQIIMRPSVGNVRTDYREDYIIWAGPWNVKRKSKDGIGLMNDFTDQRKK